MFNFSILISLIVPIVLFYFSLYFTFKKEIEDFTNASASKKSNEIESKIQNRQRKLFLLNIITIILLLIVLLLYKLPTLINIYEFLPFKKEVFFDQKFKFSYIFETILSLLNVVISIFGSIKYTHKYSPGRTYTLAQLIMRLILMIIYILLLLFGSAWLNFYISNFLIACIMQSFELLSIIVNIFIYSMIGTVSYNIVRFVSYCLEKK